MALRVEVVSGIISCLTSPLSPETQIDISSMISGALTGIGGRPRMTANAAAEENEHHTVLPLTLRTAVLSTVNFSAKLSKCREVRKTGRRGRRLSQWRPTGGPYPRASLTPCQFYKDRSSKEQCASQVLTKCIQEKVRVGMRVSLDILFPTNREKCAATRFPRGRLRDHSVIHSYPKTSLDGLLYLPGSRSIRQIAYIESQIFIRK